MFDWRLWKGRDVFAAYEMGYSVLLQRKMLMFAYLVF